MDNRTGQEMNRRMFSSAINFPLYHFRNSRRCGSRVSITSSFCCCFSIPISWTQGFCCSHLEVELVWTVWVSQSEDSSETNELSPPHRLKCWALCAVRGRKDNFAGRLINLYDNDRKIYWPSETVAEEVICSTNSIQSRKVPKEIFLPISSGWSSMHFWFSILFNVPLDVQVA